MEEKIKIEQDPLFDLYTNMKINIKCSGTLCEIHDSDFTYYCLQCKRPVCDICKESFHSSHSIQLKKDITLNSNHLSNCFERIEQLIKDTKVMDNPTECKNRILRSVIDDFEEVEQHLAKIKQKKIQEIESVFKECKSSAPLLKTLQDNKRSINQYFSSHKSDFYEADIKDEDHCIFLQTYEIYNSALIKLKEYEKVISYIRDLYEDYEKTSKFDCSGIKKEIEKAIEEEKKNEILLANLNTFDGQQQAPGTATTQASRKKSSKTATQIKEKLYTSYDVFKSKIDGMFEKLSDDYFVDLKDRLIKSEEFFNSFKKQTYESFKKNGSFIEIEKNVKGFDEKANKRVNFIKGKGKLKFSPSQAKAYSISGILPNGVGIVRSNSNASGSSSKEKRSGSDKKKKHVPNEGKQHSMKDKKSKQPVTQPNKESSQLTEANENAGLEELKEEIETDSERENKKVKEVKYFQTEGSLKSDNSAESIRLEDGYKQSIKKSRSEKKLANMFKPMKRKPRANIAKPKIDSRILSTSKKDASKYKINSELQELVKENQKYHTVIKNKDDINLSISIVRRYYSYLVLEFVRKNFHKQNYASSVMVFQEAESEDSSQVKDNIRIFEGTNEIQIFCRDSLKLVKKVVPLDKKIHGYSTFPSGTRIVYQKDRLYITGGKDIMTEYKIFLMFITKENKLYRLPDLTHSRSYHTMVYHENLKSILVFGGENNKTCEIFDFFVNTWNEIPDLHTPRANISIYIDKIGSLAYAFCGVTGSIAEGKKSDQFELLDLIDMNQGWAKIDYQNLANVDLKFSHTSIYPISDELILLYGASESRKMQKCFVTFNLRTFIVNKVSKEFLESIRLNASKNSELSKLFI